MVSSPRTSETSAVIAPWNPDGMGPPIYRAAWTFLYGPHRERAVDRPPAREPAADDAVRVRAGAPQPDRRAHGLLGAPGAAVRTADGRRDRRASERRRRARDRECRAGAVRDGTGATR